jgi:transmembrane sensor
MEKSNAKDILERYSKGLCTAEEKAWVETYYNLHDDADDNALSLQELMAELNSIEQKLPRQKRRILPVRLVAAAAAILVIGSLALWLFMQSREKTVTTRPTVAATEVIEPGGNKAFLTLANGKKISLTDAGNGQIANESGIAITKTADGQMVYKIAEAAAAETNAFNTIETPVGGQYQVQLPDGTKVWLNAQSSLRFPVRFSETERRVTITGEAYFEVAHNKAKPFRVVSDRQTIVVLGTHFNVNAYEDEGAVKTTLLEGIVKVNEATLKPGEQSILTNDSKITINKNPNLDDIVAWKNNKIQFTDTDIRTIMRMLARWYNIEVTFTGRPVNTSFGGSVSKEKNIDVILKVLETTGDVHFKTEGRRITVMP